MTTSDIAPLSMIRLVQYATPKIIANATVKHSVPLFLLDPNPLSLISSVMHPELEAHPTRLARRDMAPGTLAILVIMPIVAVGLIFVAIFVIVLRRRKRKKLHGNSPTASAIRDSFEEDLESYRRERELMGDVMGMSAGISQEDLEHQLRSAAAGVGNARDSTASGPNSRSASRHGRGDISGWYAPPAAPHLPRRGPMPNNLSPPSGSGDGTGRRKGRSHPGSPRPGSRRVSGLRNSIQQADEGEVGEKVLKNGATKIEQIGEGDAGAEKELRGFYEPEPKITPPATKHPTYR